MRILSAVCDDLEDLAYVCRKLEALRLDDETSMYDIMKPVALDVDDKLNLGQTYSTGLNGGRAMQNQFSEKRKRFCKFAV